MPVCLAEGRDNYNYDVTPEIMPVCLAEGRDNYDVTPEIMPVCLAEGRDNYDVTPEIMSDSNLRETELVRRCRLLEDFIQQMPGSDGRGIYMCYNQILTLVLLSSSTSVEVLRCREILVFAVEIALGMSYESNVYVPRNFGYHST